MSRTYVFDYHDALMRHDIEVTADHYEEAKEIAETIGEELLDELGEPLHHGSDFMLSLDHVEVEV